MPLLTSSRALAPIHLRARLPGVVLLAGVVVLTFGLCATAAHAQGPLVGGKAVKPVAAASAPKVAARPVWAELNLSQQLALQPLAPEWDNLSAAHKRKWLAVVRNYAKMAPEEQTTLHSRMTGWASLSQQQRTQARLNFADVKQVPADERKAKWEAYQALSVEQRQALAESAPPRPKGAALPAKPIASEKRFAPAPSIDGARLPRIQLAPSPATIPAAPVKVAEPPSTAP